MTAPRAMRRRPAAVPPPPSETLRLHANVRPYAAGGRDASTRRRILMVAPQPFFQPRGTPFSILHRLRGLLHLGHHVELVTYPFGQAPELPGLVLHRAARPPGVRDVPIGPSLAKVLLDFPLFARTLALARRGGFDMLHTHEEAGVMGAWISRACGMPHLYEMHSWLPEQFANFGRFNWAPVRGAFGALERYTLERSDAVIAVCLSLHDRVRASSYRGPLALIENTLDFEPPEITPEAVRALRERLGLGADPLVLYTGTFEPYQGIELLVEAAGEVTRQLPGVRFVLVGGVPRQIESLQRLARERGVASCFTLLPRVTPTEVFLYLRMADVLVSPRLRGTNTPLKIYQYLRSGKPIVATAIESHTQVLDEHTAELVAPTAPAIAAGLLRVLSDPGRRQRLVRAAGELARGRYSDRAHLESLSDILAQVPLPYRPGAATV